MKILLAVDGSPCSDAAVEEVGRRPWPEGSSVKVLSAFELPTPLAPLTPETWSLPIIYFEEMDLALRKQAQIIVERALEKLKSTMNKTIAIDGQCVPGSPRTVILDEAEAWGADLIVVGTEGHGAIVRFVLGSVTEEMVRNAPCPVLVVKASDDPRRIKPDVAEQQT